jgi:hypothetical protein
MVQTDIHIYRFGIDIQRALILREVLMKNAAESFHPIALSTRIHNYYDVLSLTF